MSMMGLKEITIFIEELVAFYSPWLSSTNGTNNTCTIHEKYLMLRGISISSIFSVIHERFIRKRVRT